MLRSGSYSWDQGGPQGLSGNGVSKDKQGKQKSRMEGEHARLREQHPQRSHMR